MGLLDPPALTKAQADANYAKTTNVDLVTMTNPPVAFPRVIINTSTGLAPTDTVTYLDATITINGAQPFSGTTQIRGRGNTTWTAPKKPWRLKLTTAASLLGMPAERDWVLLANHFDPLLFRQALAFEIGARCTGLAWTPKFRFVELNLNDTYLGVYQLGEHVEISRPNKINVTAASGTTGLALTGAYTLELDQRFDGTGFRTPINNLPIICDDPDGSNVDQFNYIRDWVNNFETVLYSSNWLDPATGYARLIDMPSFIDWYLVNELGRNLDSNFYSSVKMYKTRDTADTPGRLVFGPLWDFDNSFNNSFAVTTSPTGFHTRIPAAGHVGALWIDRMFGDPAFFTMLIARWNQLKTAMRTGDSVYAIIDRLVDRLTFAAARDKRTWGYQVDPPVSADALKTWIKTRIAWLDTQFVIDTTAPTTPSSLAASPGNAAVVLTWGASSDNVGVVKYRVRRGTTIVSEPAGTSYTDSGLTNGTAYSYTVSALDAAGNESPQTAVVSATPSASDTTPPSAPTGLTATPGNAQVVLAWTASTDNVAVTGYKVRRGGTVVGTPTATSFTDTGLTNGTAYSYTVTAVDAATNESAASATATATPTASSATVETFTGTNGAAWPTGWTTNGPATIQNNRGRLANTGTTYAFASAWQAGATPVTDFDITTAIYAYNKCSVFVGVGHAAANYINPDFAHIAKIEVNTSVQAASVILYRHNNGRTELGFAYPSGVAAGTGGWSVRMQRVGAVVRFRIWTLGGTEPSTWLLNATDSNPPNNATRPWLSYESDSTGYVEFDNHTVGAPA